MEKMGHILSCACAKFFFLFVISHLLLPLSFSYSSPSHLVSGVFEHLLHGDSIDVSLACGCLVDAAERSRVKTMRRNKKVNGFICYRECMKITVGLKRNQQKVGTKFHWVTTQRVNNKLKKYVFSWIICLFGACLLMVLHLLFFGGVFPEAKAAVFHVCADRMREEKGGMGVNT